ncbi:UDP-sugar hydrolase [Flammeovirga pectinis]|uniref:UDP-sugar hydrolase n=1 Tax=Flammeovirga pectinis TaxID=2494373 RepID=A0A3Q9FJQ9_9BACT|nr:5'-nucleotidase C-terminal domain-containing protein [Flammeovirga pectinis]AZQ61683.1 UDP-sugar hydrolase [Flammeovirga pectinis]
MKKIPILLLTLSIIYGCAPSTNVLDSSVYTSISIDNTLSESTVMDSVIAPYKSKLDGQMNQVISFTAEDLIISNPVGTLGNFVCDLSVEMAEKETGVSIDMCLMNNGGLRAPIFKGEITRRHVFKLMPFDNALYVVTMKGEAMNEMLNYIAERHEPTSGLKMGIKDNKPVKPIINGLPFDKNKEYKVLTSDYLYHGGDKMYFFQKSIKVDNVDMLIRDAIMEYTETHNPLVIDQSTRLYFL